MRMGESVSADLVAAELAEDSPARLTRAGVDEHVPHQVGVHGVGHGHRVQVPDAVGDLLHAAEGIRARATVVRGWRSQWLSTISGQAGSPSRSSTALWPG